MRLYILPKRPVFFLVSGPEHIMFAEINILKTLQRLEEYAEKKMLEAHFFGNVASPESATLSKINSITSIIQLICPPFKNIWLKENFKEKSNNFEMQCKVYFSGGVLLFIFSCCSLYI